MSRAWARASLTPDQGNKRNGCLGSVRVIRGKQPQGCGQVLGVPVDLSIPSGPVLACIPDRHTDRARHSRVGDHALVTLLRRSNLHFWVWPEARSEDRRRRWVKAMMF
jgi:hypothetical protein